MNPVFVVRLAGRAIPDTVFVSLALTAVLALALVFIRRRLRAQRIGLWQAAVETFAGWIRDLVEEVFEDNTERYVPLIGGLMVFIATANLLSLLPFVRPPTADLSTTVALALVVFFAIPYFGIRRLGVGGYLRKFAEPHPLLIPFNLIGEVTRTIALAVRLFGNVMSGQMIGAILLVVAGALVPIPLLALGVLTGLVQAYIFGVLAAVYIAAAVQTDSTTKEETHG